MTDDEFERHEVTYQEARAVLEAQQETISDVDTKAVQTVRITVVLTGILLSAWRIGPGTFDPVFSTLAGIAFVGSLVTGTFTYGESDLYLGPSKEYIEKLTDGEFCDDDWEQDLLYSFGVWVAENSEEIWFQSRLLLATQLLLTAGVVFTGLSIVL